MLAARVLPIDDDPFVAAIERVATRFTSAGRPRPLVQYQRDPVGFFRDVLGIPEHTIRWSLNPGYDKHRWDGTPDPLVVVAEALADWKNVGVESGTGTGKSFELAALILWFVACWDGARVFTFAPKEDQLRLYSWAEIRKMWPRFKARFPSAELTDLRIRMIPGSDEWGAWGWPVQVRSGEDVASRAAGMHAEHMLLIYEETQGIEPAVLDAGEQTCTGPHNLQLAVGNPDHQQDALHMFCERPDVVAVRISALDHPNVVCDDPNIVPGAVSRESVERRRKRHGEGSRLYESRVRGISPEQAEDALIRAEWIDAAVARYNDPELRRGKPARGVDVANSENGDRAAIARGIGACLLEVEAFPCPDASKLGVRVALEMALEGIEPQHVGVDSGGVGASTVNKLKELGKYVRALNAGSAAVPTIDEDLLREAGKGVRQEEVFLNLRAQMWWQMRLDLQHGRIALPDDPELRRELLTPRWEVRNGKIVIEAKEEIRKRLRGRSPDKAEAAVHWNWVRDRRPFVKDEGPKSAWDPSVLQHEARESRRVRERPASGPVIDPTILERVE